MWNKKEEERELDDYERAKLTPEGQEWQKLQNEHLCSQILWRLLPAVLAVATVALPLVLVNAALKHPESPREEPKSYEETIENDVYADDSIEMRNGAEIDISGKPRK